MKITLAGHQVEIRWPSEEPEAANPPSGSGLITIPGILVTMELPRDELKRLKHARRYTNTEIVTFDTIRGVYLCRWWAPVAWIEQYTEIINDKSIAALVPLQPIHDALARLL